MSKRFTRGFTLIELLVVIAIIGILSSVVLASLNTARGKGGDAAVKANLNNLRAQAELYYDNSSNSYTGVCSDPTFTKALAASRSAGSGTATCNSSSSAWAAQSNLKTASTVYWCVDSTGNATTSTTALGSATVCP